MNLRLVVALACAAAAVAPTIVDADEPLGADAIFGPPRPWTIDSMTARYTHYEQRGHGYQSQAFGSPGDEYLSVEQAQLEIVAHQGEHITHTLWVPLDIITAASPDAVDSWNVDAMSHASRVNESGTVELATTYLADRATTWTVHGGLHFEEPYRSWDVGLGWARSFADDNTTLAASINEYWDWFDRFDFLGHRLGRAGRSSTNVNFGITQLLSPTTIAHLDYGLTLQSGELSNTWNAVPAVVGGFESELMPGFRQRHAFVGRLVQALPWRAALHLYYRFYVDDWGLLAHTAEAQLYQRLSPWLWLRATYRVYQQNGVAFYTTRATTTQTPRTADSDLAPFVAQTVGGAIGVDLKPTRRLRELHADVGYEHYWRTNDLRADMITCGLGFRFY